MNKKSKIKIENIRNKYLYKNVIENKILTAKEENMLKLIFELLKKERDKCWKIN